MAETAGVPARVRTLAAQVGDPTPMRRGSLTERYVKCSKPGCRCAEEIEARHGPYYSLTRAEGGTTRSRYLSAEQAEVVRRADTGGQAVPASTSRRTGRPASGGPIPNSKRLRRVFARGGQKGGFKAAFARGDPRRVESARRSGGGRDAGTSRRWRRRRAAAPWPSRLAPWPAGSTRTTRTTSGPACPARADRRPSTQGGKRRHSRGRWGRCRWSGPTTTAPPAAGFCRATGPWGWRAPRSRRASRAWWGRSGALVSFAESSELSPRWRTRREAKQVERTAETLGREMAADERHVVPAGGGRDCAHPVPRHGRHGGADAQRGVAGPRRQAGGGSSKTREVKLCTVWSAEGRDAEGVPVRDEGSVSYSAAIESAASRDTDATGRPSPSACSARRAGAASIARAGKPSWATAPPGSGTLPSE